MMEEARHEQLLRIYAQTRTIAVVGASADASKAAHQVPCYLQSQGYRVLPVNPHGGELFGARVFRELECLQSERAEELSRIMLLTRVPGRCR